jgi:hypothetical protein
MKRIIPTGVQNGINTTYTLSEVSVPGAICWIAFNGQILQQVSTAPTTIQCRLVGATLTIGLAPYATDDLVAYISTSLSDGLLETPISGVRSPESVTFQIETAPPAGSSLLLFFDGLLLTEVASAPGFQQFSLADRTITFGLAPEADTFLLAFIEDPLSLSFLRTLPMSGVKSRWSTPFASSRFFAPLLLVFINGILQQPTTALPSTRQYQSQVLSNTISVTLGIDLVPADDFQVFSVGMSTSKALTPSLSVYGRLIDELLVLMNEQIDYQEARMCLNRRWQKILIAWSWSFTKADGVLSTIPPKTVGTVQVTQGSVSVIGAGTAFAATDIGGHLVMGDQPYRILDVQVITTAQQVLILDAPYVGTSNTVLPYQLVYTDYALDPDVVDIFTMTSSDRGWGEMEEMSQEQMTRWDWYRTSVAEPSHYVRKGMTGGIYQVALWPPPDARYTIRYVAITRSMLNAQGDFLPDVHELLLMAAEEMACGIVASKRAAEKDYPGAQFWQQKGEGRMVHYEESLMELKSKDRHAFGKNTYPARGGDRMSYGWGRWETWGR